MTPDEKAQTLFAAAEQLESESPKIGNFRITDGLKGLAVGLVNGTAERLTGKSMTGIHTTLARVGEQLKDNGIAYGSIRPIYELTEDGTVVYETHFDTETGEPVFAPVRQTLKGLGYSDRAVYSTCKVDEDTGRISYHPATLFSEDFLVQGMEAYVASPHCRASDWIFHLEILRGQLAVWKAAPKLPSRTTAYTNKLLGVLAEKGAQVMLSVFKEDLDRTDLAQFVMA